MRAERNTAPRQDREKPEPLRCSGFSNEHARKLTGKFRASTRSARNATARRATRSRVCIFDCRWIRLSCASFRTPGVHSGATVTTWNRRDATTRTP